MINNELENITKTAYKKVGIVLIFASFLYSLLLVSKALPSIGRFSIPLTMLLALLSSTLCFISIKNKSIRIPTLFIVCISLTIVNIYPTVMFSIVLITPAFLSIYSLKPNIIVSTTIFTFVCKVISTIIKELYSYKFITVVPQSYSNLAIIICIVSIHIIETLFIASIFIPIFRYLIDLKKHQEKTIKEKQKATSELLDFCSTATGYHNKYLSIHIKGVKEITQLLLNELCKVDKSISSYYYEQIIFSVQFHDIGKIYIDSSILDKNGKLTDFEFNLIKEHPVKGSELFNLIPKNVLDENWMQVCNNIIIQHHERLNGKGYPYGLKSNEISYEAQIVAVADVVDALLSWRPYKSPFSWDRLVSTVINDDGLNQDLVNIIINNKDAILYISNINNNLLKNMLNLTNADIDRQ